MFNIKKNIMFFFSIMLGINTFSTVLHSEDLKVEDTFKSKPSDLYLIPLITNDGKKTTLKQYEGKVLLISNTASECGFTYQYKDLQALYISYQDKGFSVLGFPSNDFGEQEPGSDLEIKTFCVKNYGVTFPLFQKGSVSGENIQPLFKLINENSNEEFQGPIEWNFEKIVIDKKGVIRGRFGSFVNPLNQKITTLIDKLLAE